MGTAVTALPESPTHGWELFARYAFPPNELGYCGPPDASVLLTNTQPAAIGRHAEGFDGAWPYLEEIAKAAGLPDPLDAEVVRTYWVGGRLLDRVDGHRMGHRLKVAMRGQPTGLLDALGDQGRVLAHHSFHVLAVYPWIRFLEQGPETPLRILQACRIRWGTVLSVDDEYAVIKSAPLLFDTGRLFLGDPGPETVRWCRRGLSLAPRPEIGRTASAHWDWVCGDLDDAERTALAAATATTIDLVNSVRQRTTTELGSRGAPRNSRCDGGVRPSSSAIP